jgi:hypothetical protein
MSKETIGRSAGQRRPWRLAASLTACVVILLMLLHRVLNPADVNRIVLINHQIDFPRPEYPLTVTMDTEAGLFTERFESGDLSPEGGLDVLPWEHAFFNGEMEVTDATDRRILRIELAPRARYSRNLVVVLHENGAVTHAWNELSEPKVTAVDSSGN